MARNRKKLSRAFIATFVLASSLSMTACGNRLKASTAANPSTVPSVPDEFNNSAPVSEDLYAPSAEEQRPIPNSAPNVSSGSFLVDQTYLNDWQAKGIAVSGGMIYLTASDTLGFSKKGTFLKMNSSDGKGWKNIGSTLFGARHPMDSTVEGLAVNGGTLIAVDSAGKVYTVETSGSNLKVIKTAGGKDIAAGAGSIYIANGAVEKTDVSATSRAPIANMSASGGVGSDNLGNVYAVSGVSIKKADATGQVIDVVTTDLSSPSDVAVDSRNGDMYVLDATMIKRFNSTGQLLISFASGATKPVGIAVDESGAVYVADFGTSNKDSKVLKFSASIDAQMSSSSVGSSSGYNYGSSSSGSSDYSTYSSTKKTITTNPRK